MKGAFWIIVVATLACSNAGPKATAADIKPEEIGAHECEACGMLIREQPAPRAQLVHKDGQRHFFCSVSDMLTYMQAPSPHGSVATSFVETLHPQDDPMEFSVDPRPWTGTREAAFVLGVAKPKVMGTPILVYGSENEAKSVSEKYKGTTVSWNKLKQTLGMKKE
jgi:copper chaperone NosL